jgi:hypothetical protein
MVIHMAAIFSVEWCYKLKKKSVRKDYKNESIRYYKIKC